MEKHDKIYIAGKTGMVGSAIARHLARLGFTRIVGPSSGELNLVRQEAVEAYFLKEKPDHVFLCSAKVGGIYANDAFPADFIYQNLSIQANIIHSAYLAGVKKLLFLGSSCIYPRLAEQPITENSLLSGPLEPTNEPLAVAKIAGIRMCQAYNRQYGTRFLVCMPTNLYGPGDNYDLMEGHVLPALFHRIHKAHIHGDPTVLVWGSGNPTREFLHVDDLAEACVILMLDPRSQGIVNIGSGEEISIAELARAIAEVVGYPGDLVFDRSRPDGAPRKFLDSSKIMGLGWRPRTRLRDGLRLTYRAFLQEQGQRERAKAGT